MDVGKIPLSSCEIDHGQSLRILVISFVAYNSPIPFKYSIFNNTGNAYLITLKLGISTFIRLLSSLSMTSPFSSINSDSVIPANILMSVVFPVPFSPNITIISESEKSPSSIYFLFL